MSAKDTPVQTRSPEIDEKKPEDRQIAYVGLGNQGATCYMNSFLQMLFMIPEFRNEMLQWKYDPDLHGPARDFIPYQLQKLFAKMQMREIDYLETKGLTVSFKWEKEDSFVQHDVQEFSKVLFEALEVSFASTAAYDSVDQLFQGESLNYIKCKNNGCDSSNLEKWLDLQLVIENPWEKINSDRLEKSLQVYLRPEILEKSEQYACSKCEKKVDAEKGVSLLKLPKVLCLNVNRFTYDPMSGSRVKLGNFYSFPFILNMNEYINGYEGIRHKYNLHEVFDETGEAATAKNPSTVSNAGDTSIQSSVKTKPKSTKKYHNAQSSSKTKSFLAEMKKKAKKDLKPDDVIVVAEPKKLIEGAEELSMADSTTLTQGKSEGEVLHKKQLEPIDEDSDIANINKPARKRSQSLTEELGLYKQSSSQSEGVQSTKINSETQQNELNGNTNSSRETQHNTSLQSSEFSLTSPDQKASGSSFIPPPPNIDEFRYIMSVPDPVTMRAGSPEMTPQLLAKVSNAQNFEGNSIGIQATAIPMPAPAPKKRSDVVEKRIREMVEIDEESTIQIYFKDGPLVYQLAGVLIHRGGAYGGHYYAYIRSFEDGEWHLFDDAIIKTVTKMQVAEEGFGGKNLSASGYMLFYQIVEDIIPQGNWLEIPKDLKDICSAELAKEREQVAKNMASYYSHEMKENKFMIKVYYKTDVKPIEVDIKDKLCELISRAKKELKLEEEKDSNIRLRLYKPKEDIMLDTYTGMDGREILYLGIGPNKCYALERKQDDEEFGEYDPCLIKVKCLLYEPGTISSDSESSKGFFVCISRRRPIKDFEVMIRKELNIPEEEYFHIFKRRVISDSMKEAHLLNSEENLIYSLEEMKVYEATKILIERIPEGFRTSGRPVSLEQFDEEKSSWVQLIEKENYNLLIRYNLPSLNPNSEMATFDQELMIDSRLMIADLKCVISEQMEVEEDKFILRRGGKVGIELRDPTKTLLKCGLLSGSVIYTAFGTPTGPNEVLLKMLMTVKDDNELSHHYNLKPIAEIAIDQNSTPEQVIAKTVLACAKEEGVDLSSKTFRLREKHSRSLMKVYRDMPIKRQGIHDGKQLVIENIDHSIHVPKLEMRQYLLVVRIINPDSIEFEDVFEFAIEKTDTMASLAQKVSDVCPKIPLEFMEAAKVTAVWGLDTLYSLNLPYVALNDQKQLLTGQPFFINADGVVLILKDSRKKFRELNDSEKAALKGRSQFTEDCYDFVALNISRIKTKPKEKVMKIYATQKLKDTDVQKMKDREELDRQKDKTEVKETSMAKNPSDTDVNAETSEPEYGYIEALF